MQSPAEIMLENLKGSLNAAQHYYFAGVTAALFCGLIAFSAMPVKAPKIPILQIEAAPAQAAVVAGLASSGPVARAARPPAR